MIVTATDLLRTTLVAANNEAETARKILSESTHPERYSALRILRRTLHARIGATIVRYKGRGLFEADVPHLTIVAVDFDDPKVTRKIADWDEARWGKLRTNGAYGSAIVDQIKADLAPNALRVRVVNHVGVTVAMSPSTFASTPPVRCE